MITIMDNNRNRTNIIDFILNRENTTKIKIINIKTNITVNIMKISVDNLKIDREINKILIMINMRIYKCKD